MLLKISENLIPLQIGISIVKINGYRGLQGNELSLNVVKTQAMVIGSQPNLKKIADKRVDTPSFSIGDSAIDLVNPITTGGGGTKCPRRRLFDAVLSVRKIQS